MYPEYVPGWVDDGYIDFEGYCRECGAGMRYWNDDCNCTDRAGEAHERERVQDLTLGLSLGDLEWMAGVFERG